MLQQTFKQCFYIVLVGLSVTVSSSACARDIGVEQRATSAARDEYNQAKSEVADNSHNIVAQEKRVADEQARLKQLQNNQATANTRLEKAKANLEIKEKALEKIWEERNR